MAEFFCAKRKFGLRKKGVSKGDRETLLKKKIPGVLKTKMCFSEVSKMERIKLGDEQY